MSLRGTTDFLKGKAFQFLLSCADGAPEGPSQAEGPSGGGPLARWHKPQLSSLAENDSDQKGLRADWWSQPKHAKKALWAFFGSLREQQSKRAYTRTRLRAVEKSTASSRTFSDSNPHAARTVRSKILRAVSILSGYTLFRTEHGKILPPTHICAFRSLPRGQKRSHRDLFCMFRLTLPVRAKLIS